MEEIKIKASVRKEAGTSEAKRLRRSKFIPGVVYGKDINTLIKIEKPELKYLKAHHFSENILINLEVKNEESFQNIPVLLKDYQLNPLTEEIIHLDFIKVSLEEKVAVEVPLEIKGSPKGVKVGGVLERVLWNLKVECLPKDIPESIVVDVSELDIGDSIHVGDLVLPSGVIALTEPKEVVVTVLTPMEEEEAVSEEEVAEEPEVIKEKPKEEKESSKEEES